MSRTAYYKQMCRLAAAKRSEYKIDTLTLNLTAVRRIYKAEGIRIDRWNIKGSKIKAAYFCDDHDCSVLLNKNLPKEPKLFALVHELKHHYVDQDEIRGGQIHCGDYNANEVIEIGAEVYAAEFIYPETEMRQLAETLGIGPGACSEEQVVEFKRNCPATVSYKFITKRFEWFGFIPKNAFNKVRFQNLEEEIYGPPFYKQDWFKRARARKK